MAQEVQAETMEIEKLLEARSQRALLIQECAYRYEYITGSTERGTEVPEGIY